MSTGVSVYEQKCKWSTVRNCVKCGKLVRKKGDTVESFLQAMAEFSRVVCDECANPALKPKRRKKA